MSRFKQPLSPVSRLSDRIGGGADKRPILISSAYTTAAQNWGDFAPAGIQAGDLIVAVRGRIITDPVTPTGYTQAQFAVNGNDKCKLLWRVATGDASDGFSNEASAITSVLVFRNHGGFGQTAKQELAAAGAASLTLSSMPDADSVVLAGLARSNMSFAYGGGGQAEAGIGWTPAVTSGGASNGNHVLARLAKRPPATIINLRFTESTIRALVVAEILPK